MLKDDFHNFIVTLKNCKMIKKKYTKNFFADYETLSLSLYMGKFSLSSEGIIMYFISLNIVTKSKIRDNFRQKNIAVKEINLPNFLFSGLINYILIIVSMSAY